MRSTSKLWVSALARAPNALARTLCSPCYVVKSDFGARASALAYAAVRAQKYESGVRRQSLGGSLGSQAELSCLERVRLRLGVLGALQTVAE